MNQRDYVVTFGCGPFVPKPSSGAGRQHCCMPDLETTVRQRLLASTGGGGDCHSLGHSAVAHEGWPMTPAVCVVLSTDGSMFASFTVSTSSSVILYEQGFSLRILDVSDTEV